LLTLHRGSSMNFRNWLGLLVRKVGGPGKKPFSGVRRSRTRRWLVSGCERFEERRPLAADLALFSIRLVNGVPLMPDPDPALIAGSTDWTGLADTSGASQVADPQMAAVTQMASWIGSRLGLNVATMGDAEISAAFRGDSSADTSSAANAAAPVYTFSWSGMEWDLRQGAEGMEFLPLDGYGFHNPNAAIDVNNDGYLAPLDALLVINQLNAMPTSFLPNRAPASMAAMMLDVTGDRLLTPQDALLVINDLNSDGSGEVGRRIFAVDDDHSITLPYGSIEFPSTPIYPLANDYLGGNVTGSWDLSERPGVRVVSVGTPTFGQVELFNDSIGQSYSFVVYTPGESFTGTDSFTYVVQDAFGDRDEATVYVSYRIEDPPLPSFTLRAPTTIFGASPGAAIDFRDAEGDGLIAVDYPGDPSTSVGVMLDYQYGETPFGLGVVGKLTTDAVVGDVSLVPNRSGGVWLVGKLDEVNATLAGLRFEPSAGFAAPDGVGLGIYVFTPGGDNLPQNYAYGLVSLVVPAAELSPVAGNDSVEIRSFDRPVRLDVLANDTSPTGSPLRIVGVSAAPGDNAAASESWFGRFAIDTESNQIVYQPNTVFSGPDSFVYVVSDAEGRLSQGYGAVVGFVDWGASRLQANNDQMNLMLPAGTTAFPAVDIDVLGNDFPGDTTTDSGDPATVSDLRIVFAGGASNGAVELVAASSNQDRTFLRYTPGEAFDGSDLFYYTIEDRLGNRSQASVFVSYSIDTSPSPNIILSGPTRAVASAPGAAIDFRNADGSGSISIEYNGPAPIQVRVFLELSAASPFGLAAPGKLTSSTANPEVFFPQAVGSVFMSGTLEQVDASLAGLRYEPAAGFSAVEGLKMLIYVSTYSADAAIPEFSYREVELSVPADAMAPLATQDSMEVAATKGPFRLNVLANDTSPTGSPLRLVDVITFATLSNASPDLTIPKVAIDAQTNEIVYQPFEEFSGSDTFIYLVADADGRISQGNVSIYSL
jgi:Bacterial Ig domain/Dockerin type I domain